MLDLHAPRFAQAEVLEVTGLKATVLQNWINREAIELEEHNPGSGKRRLYAPISVAKLAVMRRCADFNLDLGVSKRIAEAVASHLRREHSRDLVWDDYIAWRPSSLEAMGLTLTRPSQMSPLLEFGWERSDPSKMLVSEYVEPPAAGDTFWRRQPANLEAAKRDGSSIDHRVQPIDENRRISLARNGIHAEPVLIIPVGEIALGAIAQLEKLVEAEIPQS